MRIKQNENELFIFEENVEHEILGWVIQGRESKLICVRMTEFKICEG